MRLDNFPRNELEFHERFSDEERCREYLSSLRWPDGFVCPQCGCKKGWRRSHRDEWICAAATCGKETSLRSGTVLHNSPKPLKAWLLALYHVAVNKQGVSALRLQTILGFGGYNTALRWLREIRRVLANAETSQKLEAEVEVDEVALGGVEKGGKGPFVGKTWVVGAVERKCKGCGRVRLRVIGTDRSGDTLCDFVKEVVEDGAIVNTDAFMGYAPLTSMGYAHDARTTTNGKGGGNNQLKLEDGRTKAEVHLPQIHKVFSLVERIVCWGASRAPSQSGTFRDTWTSTPSVLTGARPRRRLGSSSRWPRGSWRRDASRFGNVADEPLQMYRRKSGRATGSVSPPNFRGACSLGSARHRSLSHTRGKLLAECPRAAYLQYYPWGDTDQHLARFLRRAVTCDSLAGTIVHNFIQTGLRQFVRRGVYPVGLAEHGVREYDLALRQSEKLATVVRAGRRPPEHGQCAFHHLYGKLDEVGEERGRFTAFETSPALEFLKGTNTDKWERITTSSDDVPSFYATAELGFDKSVGLRVYAAYDIAFEFGSEFHVVDWKTGVKGERSRAAARRQLAVYDLWAMSKEKPMESIRVQGYHLQEGEPWSPQPLDPRRRQRNHVDRGARRARTRSNLNGGRQAWRDRSIRS